MTRKLTLIVAVTLLLTGILGCTGAKNGNKPNQSGASASIPADLGFVDDLKITGFNWGWDNPIPEQDVVAPELTKRLGLNSLTYDILKLGSYDDVIKRMQLWSSAGGSDWPSFVTPGADNQAKSILNSMGEGGKLEDLTPWLEKWPNVKKAVEKLLPLMKNANDGKLYYIPQNFSDMKAAPLDRADIWIRQDWLDQLGLPYPQTMDELYTTLKAFKDQIKEANGQAVIPYMAFGEGFHHMIGLFFPEGHYSVQNMWYTDGDGNAAFAPIATPDNLIRAMKFYNKLYKEGLIEKEAFSIKQGQADERGNQGRYGAVHGAYWQMANVYTDAMKPTKPDAMFVGIPVYDSAIASAPQTMKFKLEAWSLWAVKNDIPDEEINTFFKALDYVLSEEGTVLVKFGIEGDQWQRSADGKIEDTPAFFERTQGDWNKRAHEGVDIYSFIPNYEAYLKNLAPTALESRQDMIKTWENIGYKYPEVINTEPQAYVTSGEAENSKWLGQTERYNQMIAKAVTASNEADVDGIVNDWVAGEKARGYDQIIEERNAAAKSIDLSSLQ